MKIFWKYNAKTEIGRLLFTASCIARGINGRFMYYILPEADIKESHRTVIFPRIIALKNLWQKLNKAYDIPVVEKDSQLVKTISSFVRSKSILSAEVISKAKSDWLTVERETLKILEAIFPDIFIVLKRIYIYPTRYGSVGSCDLPDNENTAHIYYRIDCGPWVIAELLLAAYFSKLTKIGRLPKDEVISQNFTKSQWWEFRENMIDFMMKSTELAKLFPDFKPTLMFANDRTNLKLVKKSSLYLEELGMKSSPLILLKGDRVGFVGDDRLILGLNRQEKLFLSELLRRRGEPISYNDISDLLWGDQSTEKFSLSAMNKLVCKLRARLRKNGVWWNPIKSYRGVGYVYVE